MLAMTLALQPSSASRRQAALRRPWTEASRGNPASQHLRLNQCVKLSGKKYTAIGPTPQGNSAWQGASRLAVCQDPRPNGSAAAASVAYRP